jgi:hypothetical protein
MHFGRHFASSLGRFRLASASTLEPAASSGADRPALRRAVLLDAVEHAEHTQQIRELLQLPRHTTSLVFRERAAGLGRPTYRYHRGEFLQPRETVTPHVPAALHPFPDDAPRDRLGFARWLVARQNPLVARVAVNRVWAALFGRGIVETVEDFGAQGSPPSHPALLDWLAVEFMEGGWSTKALHRLIVTSATYRQSSARRAPGRHDAAARDPENRLLSRAPRVRLPAEVLRDSVLAAAGVLDRTRFGPPVRPPQPPGITEVAFGNPRWEASEGRDRFRRSIYTFAKRTTPFAFYETFDAPSGESCTARREVSTTPLQALALLNDPMMVEIARAFGERLAAYAAEHGDARALQRAFRLVLTRPQTEPEVAELTGFLRRVTAGRARDVHAAWTAVARALFALDETATRN